MDQVSWELDKVKESYEPKSESMSVSMHASQFGIYLLYYLWDFSLKYVIGKLFQWWIP